MSVITDTRVARSADRILALPERARRRPWIAVSAVVGLAALVYMAGLGRSSLFIDEVFSWRASSGGLGGIAEAVRGAEVTPPLYYVVLHAWMLLTGSDSEWAMRLPSALAGIGLVMATIWLAITLHSRSAGLLAGLLTALSPLTLQYAQEVRAYVFVMLAVVLAAVGVVKLAAEPSRLRWLALAAGASALAVLLHYPAVLVLGPMAVWLWFAREVPLRARIAVAASVALPMLALAPLLMTQLAAGHHTTSVDDYARITPIGLLRLASTPFDGRPMTSMTLSYELGLIALVDALALLAFADAFRHQRGRWLLVGAAVVPLVAVIAVSAMFTPFAITRYTAVASPFMLVAIAIAVLRAPRALGVGLLALALIAGTIGIAASYTDRGQWPDLRGSMTAVAEDWRPGDVIVSLEDLSYGGAMSYYDQRLLPPGAPASRGYGSAYAALDAPPSREALGDGHSVWVVSAAPVAYDELRGAAARAGAEVLTEEQFPGSYPVQVNRVERP